MERRRKAGLMFPVAMLGQEKVTPRFPPPKALRILFLTYYIASELWFVGFLFYVVLRMEFQDVLCARQALHH